MTRRAPTHHASVDFWRAYRELPQKIRELADDAYEKLNRNPSYPSLHLKPVGRYWSARVGKHYRALAARDGDVFIWVWIGNHDDYERLIS